MDGQPWLKSIIQDGLYIFTSSNCIKMKPKYSENMNFHAIELETSFKATAYTETTGQSLSCCS